MLDASQSLQAPCPTSDLLQAAATLAGRPHALTRTARPWQRARSGQTGGPAAQLRHEAGADTSPRHASAPQLVGPPLKSPAQFIVCCAISETT